MTKIKNKHISQKKNKEEEEEGSFSIMKKYIWVRFGYKIFIQPIKEKKKKKKIWVRFTYEVFGADKKEKETTSQHTAFPPPL
jgi:hypothetical protein